MFIEKNIQDYLVSSGMSLVDTIRRLNRNDEKIVFVCSENNELIGSVTDGDVRRYIAEGELDLDQTIDIICNKKCVSVREEDCDKDLQGHRFDTALKIVPVINARGVIQKVIRFKNNSLSIGQFVISDQSKCLVIAEIGNNHQGDVSLAKKLSLLAKDAGADVVKFQMRNIDSLYNKKESFDLGSEYTLDLLNKFQLSNAELIEVFDYCYEIGIPPMCTPWDAGSLDVLESYGMIGYKVASADFTNFPLLEKLIDTNKTLIISTGMSTEAEVAETTRFLKRRSAKFVLLHCNSTYPTPFKDVNLSYLSTLKTKYSDFVGYSGHERGIEIPIAAVAMGAKVVEKHFTIDQGLEGNDHKVSLLPDQFLAMVKAIRNVEESLGKSDARVISQGELINRENLAKSIICDVAIKVGEVITRDKLSFKSPGIGLQPNRVDELVGLKSIRDVDKFDYFYESDIQQKRVGSVHLNFSRPIGVPVRYHDVGRLIQKANLDFVEFHLSYRDLDYDLALIENLEVGDFCVHCPELFESDHILDLASEDPVYLQQSIIHFRRVCSHVNQLRTVLKYDKPVKLVLNAGGWNQNGFLSEKSKGIKYEIFKNALLEFQSDPGIEIAIQTMPPFPWHFGGQSFHNLFVCAKEIKEFCEASGAAMCLDISHSQMACNYYGWNLYDFIESIKDHVIYMHISDAKGDDGEGVEMGHGDIDFHELGAVLNRFLPQIPLIPEIWQGHKDEGSGFWDALIYLEGHLKN
jgi:N-acetylneuraminate synthase